uniref:Protein AHNAK2 n=1 Tax=Terrapene triunguis TaxID=2587831 RepID=A0A674JLD0_9SAUR
MSIQEPKVISGSAVSDVSIPETDIKVAMTESSTELKSPEIVAKIPSADIAIDRGEMKLEGFEGKTKMPKFQKMKFGISLPKGEIPESEVSLPQMEADIPKPKAIAEVTEIAFETSSLDIKSEDSDAGTDVSGLKMQLPSLKMPQIPKADGAPKVDISLPSVDVTMPTTKVDIRGPDLESKVVKTESEIKSGEKDIEGKESKFKMPKFKLPSFSWSPKKEAVVTCDTEGKTKKPQFSMPKISLPKMKGHKAQVSLPKLESDVSGPKPENEGDVSISTSEFSKPEIKAPKMDMDVSLPTVDVILPTYDGTIQQADLKLRSAGADVSLSAPAIKIPTSEGSIELQSPETGVEGISAGIAVDGAEMKVEGLEGKIKMPKFQKPKFGISLEVESAIPNAERESSDSNTASKLPKFKLPSFSWSPKKEASIKADFEAPLEEPKITVSSGKTDTKLAETVNEEQGPSMDLDIEISTGKEEQKSQIKKPQFTMPKISFSKIKVPKSQVNLPKVEADVTVPKPERDGEDLVQIPDIESSHTKSIEEGAQISIKMPKVQIPTLEFSKPEIKVPKSDMDISLPKVDATFPTYDVSLQQADLKLGSAGDDPKFGISLPKGKRPESEISLPKMEAGVPQLTMTTDIADIAVEAPILEIKSDVSDAEIEVSDVLEGKIKSAKAEIPKVGVSLHKGKSSDVTSSKFEAEVSLPPEKAVIKVSIPETETYADVVKRGAEGQQLKTHTPKVMIPKAELSTSEISASKTGVDISLPKADITLPKCDLTLQEQKAKLECAEIPTAEHSIELKSPEIGAKAPSVEIALDGTQKKLDALPKVELDILHAGAGVKTEKLGSVIKSTGKDVQGRESKLKMPKFSVPSFGWPATKGTGDVADVKTNLEETKIGAPGIKMDTEISVVDHEIEFPAESVEKDISAGVRVKVEDGDEASKMKTSKFKMPKFGVLHSKAKGSEVDVFLPKLEADVSLPKTELGIVEIQFKKADGSIDLQSPSLDLMESSTRISKDKPDKQSESVEVNIKIPKLKIPAFTYNAPTVETDVSTSKVATDLKGAGTDIETPKLEVSTRIPKERPEFAGGNIQTPSVKIPTLAERDIKTPQVYVKVPDSSVSKAALQIQGLVAESKEIKTQGEAESGHVDIETHETYSSQIVKESEIPSSEIKTASFGFSLLKVKIPESHVKLDMPVKLQSYTEYKHEVSESEVHQPKLSDENLGVAIQKTGTAEFKLSGKPQSETDESNDVVSSSVSLPKLKTFTVEVQPSSKLGDTQSDKQPEEIAVSPLSKDDEIAKIPEDEEKDMKDQKEKTDSKRSSGRFKFWLPSIGFSSSVDDTGSDSKPEVQKSIPEETQPVDSSVSDTDSSQQTEKTGWFRFPKLGFSSPSKKAKNVDKEEETNLKEMKTSDDESPSEKPETFFDAEESLSPKEETITGEENETTGTSSNVQVSGAIVTSSARTELILLERERASQQSILEKTTK